MANLKIITLAIFSNLNCWVYSQSLVSQVNSNYNQVCSQASQCNKSAGLYCIPTPPSGQQRCGCPTNATIYDEYQGRCVGRVGYPCVYHGNESFCPEKARCSHQNPHTPDLFYLESRCFCDLNYFGDRGGRCVLAAKFGESCSASSKKCDEVSGLKCVDGKCVCLLGPDQQYYDPKKDKCISYIGKNCTGFNSCPENARCDGAFVYRTNGNGNRVRRQLQKQLLPPITGGRTLNIKSALAQNFGRFSSKVQEAENSTKMDKRTQNFGKCICDFGFTTTRNGRCLASYRQQCSRIQPCNYEDNLDCLDGSCNCKSPLHQVYDHLAKKCSNLVGAKCDGGNSNSCVDNSLCVGGICICKEGFSRTPHRFCKKGFGQFCEDGECNGYLGLTCKSSLNTTILNNSNNGLKPTGGKKCLCVDDNLSYVSQIEACVSPVGSPCGKIGQAGDYGKESYYISCMPSATCMEETGGDKSSKVCRILNKDL